MILPLLRYGNPLLRAKAEPVTKITDEIRQFVKDLEDTMRSFDGLGIAAPQVGKRVAIFLIAPPIGEDEKGFIQAPTRVFINPKLSAPSQELWSHSEANPVLPEISGQVLRPNQITVTAQDIDGREFTETFTDWPARVIMHENDHLNGVLFIDRLSPKERKQIETQLQLLKKN